MGTSAPEADAAENSDDHISLSVPTPRSLRGLSPAAKYTGVPKGAPENQARRPECHPSKEPERTVPCGHTHTGVPRRLQELGHPPQEGPAQSLGQGPQSPSNIRDTKAAPSI